MNVVYHTGADLEGSGTYISYYGSLWDIWLNGTMPCLPVCLHFFISYRLPLLDLTLQVKLLALALWVNLAHAKESWWCHPTRPLLPFRKMSSRTGVNGPAVSSIKR